MVLDEGVGFDQVESLLSREVLKAGHQAPGLKGSASVDHVLLLPSQEQGFDIGISLDMLTTFEEVSEFMSLNCPTVPLLEGFLDSVAVIGINSFLCSLFQLT